MLPQHLTEYGACLRGSEHKYFSVRCEMLIVLLWQARLFPIFIVLLWQARLFPIFIVLLRLTIITAHGGHANICLIHSKKRLPQRLRCILTRHQIRKHAMTCQLLRRRLPDAGYFHMSETSHIHPARRKLVEKDLHSVRAGKYEPTYIRKILRDILSMSSHNETHQRHPVRSRIRQQPAHLPNEPLGPDDKIILSAKPALILRGEIKPCHITNDKDCR